MIQPITDIELCTFCSQTRHFCIGKDGQCGNATGHYGINPADFCDECRLENIKNFGIAGDEPPNVMTELSNSRKLQ